LDFEAAGLTRRQKAGWSKDYQDNLFDMLFRPAEHYDAQTQTAA
jgi:hypothetical protein